jgi:Na+-transporting methylmalonyl-CoA/oxaloacetate decarboxylase gamma subunit
MESVPWKFALQVFGIGFGGVFVCLVLLQLFINLFSKVITVVEKMTKQNTGEELSGTKE